MMRRSLVLSVLATITLVGSACSLYLDWDPDGLPCGADDACADGYSCMISQCVANGSIGEGETCSHEDQCKGAPDVTCGSDPFTCRRKCTEVYETTSTCRSGEYCRPELSRSTVGQAVGTCVDSACVSDDDCQSQVCVQVTSSARTCMQLCQFEFVTGAGGTKEYVDRCTGTSGGQVQYCQAIGPKGTLTFVCLDLGEGLSRQQENSPCEPVTNPCAKGLVCVDTPSRCHKLCDAQSGFPCEAGTSVVQACVPLEGSNGKRVCEPLCPASGCN